MDMKGEFDNYGTVHEARPRRKLKPGEHRVRSGLNPEGTQMFKTVVETPVLKTPDGLPVPQEEEDKDKDKGSQRPTKPMPVKKDYTPYW
jgi:hypothetical protein